MLRKQTFDNNIYMKLFRWAYLFLISNLCFLVAILPFFLAACLLAIDIRNLPFFLLGLLCFGPALSALFVVINTFKEEQEVEPVRSFFKAYKTFGLRGMIFWLPCWLGAIITITDSLFFAKFSYGQWLIPFFLLLLLILTGWSIHCLYFQVRNPDASIKSVGRIAFYYTLRKWYASLLNIVLFSLMLLLMMLKPQFGFILTPALFAGIIYLNAGKLHMPKQTAVD
ncbi:DUF624 domain-containing protein [Enterococcus sp. LJL128]|uniref:DUF624 domain-containing protein n=1 Tax=Enterococcus sp. LJL51 TaxID=3416656 RepID=UPI003CF3011E